MEPAAELYQIRNNTSNVIASESECEESEQECDSDSDDQTWKRRKATTADQQPAVSHSKAFLESASKFCDDRKNGQGTLKHSSKLNVWSNVLQQRALTEELRSVGVHRDERVEGNDRGSESYEYPGWDRPANGHRQRKLPIWKRDSQEIHRRLGLKRSRKDRGKQLTLLTKEKRSFQVTAANTEEEVVTAIATILREPKQDLIGRTVSVLGKEKALSFLQMTEDIEANNGMMTADQSRRRTPGGVFLLLVRNDRDVTKEQLDKIFVEDRRQQTVLKKEAVKTKRRMKAEAQRAKQTNKAEQQLQEMVLFPTREELVLEEAMKSRVNKMATVDDEKEPGELTDSDNEMH